MPRTRGRKVSIEEKVDAAMRRRYLQGSGMPYAVPRLSALGSYMAPGTFAINPMTGLAARRYAQQLSMTGKTLPAKKWAEYSQMVSEWSTKVDNYKKDDVWDQSINAAENLDHADNKDKVLLFTDDAQTDYWSSMLSPMYGGPIQINVPVPATYKSPIHYVEGMKVISSSSPGMLFGGVAQAVFNGGINMTPCDIAKTQIDYTLQNPYAQMVVGSTAVCKDQAITTGFYKLQSEPCKFWTSLWLALFSKHMGRGPAASRGSYSSALLSTGKKLLIYQSSSAIYGVEELKMGDMKGTNAVGIILMILRALAQKGQLIEQNAGPAWEKIAKPLLEALLNPDGQEFK